MKKIAANCNMPIEVISGGLIITNSPKPISVIAGWLTQNIKNVADSTGIEFGNDYLWHINNPDWSDWFPSSEKPAIALCVFKEFHPHRQVAFAADLLYALQYEGRDLGDDEAYRHLLEKYTIPAGDFYSLLKDPVFKNKAYQEFDLCKQLQVTGFPALFIQVGPSKIVQVSSGYTAYDMLSQQIETIMQEYKL